MHTINQYRLLFVFNFNLSICFEGQFLRFILNVIKLDADYDLNMK